MRSLVQNDSQSSKASNEALINNHTLPPFELTFGEAGGQQGDQWRDHSDRDWQGHQWHDPADRDWQGHQWHHHADRDWQGTDSANRSDTSYSSNGGNGFGSNPWEGSWPSNYSSGGSAPSDGIAPTTSPGDGGNATPPEVTTPSTTTSGGTGSEGPNPTTSAGGTSTDTSLPTSGTGSNGVIESNPSVPGEFVNGQQIFQQATWLTSAPTGQAENLQQLVGTENAPILQTVSSGYNQPVETADGSNGYTNVSLPGGQSVEVPTPEGGLQPSTGSDGHLSVVDLQTGKDYDFWRLTQNGSGGWSASYEQTADLSGNGTPGTTAIGVAGLAGDVSSYELQNGINHALNIVADSTWLNSLQGNQGPVSNIDGPTPGAPLSEGGKISLPANLNLSQFNLTTAGLNLAEALQKYGGLITDMGSTDDSFAIYTSDVQTSPNLGSGWSQLVPYFQYSQ